MKEFHLGYVIGMLLPFFLILEAAIFVLKFTNRNHLLHCTFDDSF